MKGLPLAGKPQPDRAVRKHQTPCRFFASRSCTKGDLCPFSHESTAGRPETQGPVVVAETSTRTASSSPVLCQFFLKGTCKKGEGCNFTHGSLVEAAGPFKPPGMPPTEQISAGTDSRSEVHCRFFAVGEGTCRSGDACPFLHSKNVETAAVGEQETGGWNFNVTFAFYPASPFLSVSIINADGFLYHRMCTLTINGSASSVALW
jgi:hypothetical protein